MGVLRDTAVFTAKLRSSFGKPLSNLDVLLLEDYTKPHRGTLVCMMELDGDIDLPKIKELFIKNILHAVQNHTKLRFPELTQYQVSHLGFRFWRQDPNFHIDNHFQEVFANEKDAPPGFASQHEILQTLTTKPYLPNRSPWEVYVIRNLTQFENPEKSCTLFVLRGHHSMLDGFSILNIINAMTEKIIDLPPGAYPDKREKISIVRKLGIVTQGMIGLGRVVLNNRAFRRGRITSPKKTGTGSVNVRISPKVLKTELKEICTKYDVRMSSLLVTIIAESLGRFLKSKVPNIFASYVLPWPHHPDGLCNHAGAGPLEVILSEEADMATKLKTINENFLGLRAKPETILASFMVKTLGNGLPAFGNFVMKKCAYTPVAISNFVVDNEGFNVNGLDCTNCLSCVAPYNHVADSMFIILGYRDKIQVVCVADDRLLTVSEVEQIAADIGSCHKKLLGDTLADDDAKVQDLNSTRRVEQHSTSV